MVKRELRILGVTHECLIWKEEIADSCGCGLGFKTVRIPLLTKCQLTPVPVSHPLDIPFELFFIPPKESMQGTMPSHAGG